MLTSALVALSICCMAASAQPVPSLKEILDQHQANLRLISSRHEKSRRMLKLDEPSPKGIQWYVTLTDACFDGDRLDISDTNWEASGPDERDPPQSAMEKGRAQYIWDGERCYFYLPRGEDQMSLLHIGEDPRYRERVLTRGTPSGPLYGVFEGTTTPLDDLLLSAQSSEISAETTDGSTLLKVHAVTPEGDMTVYFAPSQGYQIVRASVTKKPGDLFFGEPVAQSDSPGIPPDAPVGVEFDLDYVKVKRINDAWVSVSGEWRIETHNADGSVSTGTTTYECTQFDLQPDFTQLGAFSLTVKDGTRVTLLDRQAQPPLEWRDGKIVPVVLKEATHRIVEELGKASAMTVPETQEALPGKAAETPTERTKDLSSDKEDTTTTHSAGVAIIAVLLLVVGIVTVAARRHRRSRQH